MAIDFFELTSDHFGGLSVTCFAAMTVLRTVVWNTTTNVVPDLTAPAIIVEYAPDRSTATVTMSCGVQDAVIRYSTNGRYATTHVNSPVYTGPITVHQSTVFHACWYFNGLKSYAGHASVYLKF